MRIVGLIFLGESVDGNKGACQTEGGGLMMKDQVVRVMRLACEMGTEDKLHAIIAMTGVQDCLGFGDPGKAGKNGRTVFHEMDQIWNAVSGGLEGGVVFCGTVPAGVCRLVFVGYRVKLNE